MDKSGFLGIRRAVYEWIAVLSWLVAERLYGMRSSLEWRLSGLVFQKSQIRFWLSFLFVLTLFFFFLRAYASFKMSSLSDCPHTHTVGSLSCCVIWAESACHVFLVVIVTSNCLRRTFSNWRRSHFWRLHGSALPLCHAILWRWKYTLTDFRSFLWSVHPSSSIYQREIKWLGSFAGCGLLVPGVRVAWC